MADTATRPPASRGRSTARGGRGGFGRGGSRAASKQTNGDHRAPQNVDTSADEGELYELKQKYSGQLSFLKEMFPDWTEADLVLALQESDGDLQRTTDRITEGNVSQFAEVKKKTKDRSRSKAKDASGGDTDAAATSTRSGRGRGTLEGRGGGRGRGDRGRGGFRGGRGGGHAAANGTRTAAAPVSVPTTESSAWDVSAPDKGGSSWDASAAIGDGAPEGWGSTAATEPTPAPAPEVAKPSSLPDSVAKKPSNWAGLFAPKPAPAAPKPAAAPVEAPPVVEPPAPEPAETQTLPIPPVADEVVEPETPAEEPAVVTPEVPAETPPLEITPPKEPLTEENVEHLPDASVPAPVGTVASTVGSSRDLGSATPSMMPQAPIGRPPISGYATAAHKLAGQQIRTPSFQRRIMEQQEPVVMPGNHAVDRATVQFGSIGLNGDVDAANIDEDREEAETRAQPPQHSPTTQPRTSLPPAPRQPSLPSETPAQQDALPTPKQAPGLPPPPQQQPQQQIPQQDAPTASIGSQMMSQQGSQNSHPYNQFGRYGQPNMQSENSAPAQKPYDPFGHQTPQQHQFDAYPAHSQAPTQPQNQAQAQAQAQAQLGGFSSAPNDYSSYYTSDQQRGGYQNYYNNAFGQQGGGSQQEAGTAQQRAGSAFNGGPESAFPTSQVPQAPARYGEAQNSGHTTPNPAISGQHQQANIPSQQGQHMHQQGHNQAAHAGGFAGYAHPYYKTPYYQAYASQFGQYGQQGYGGPYGGNASMYGQPHHGYGMNPQSSYDAHSSSPANAGGFGQSSMHGRDSLGGGLSEYGRSGSTQPATAQQHNSSSGGFGGMNDPFGRSPSGFPGQNQAYGQQQGGQQGGNEDALKPFGDTKATAGPSPTALGQPNRPGSTTNTAPGQSAQAGLPPPASHQQNFGGYPNHLGGQGSQYGALGGLGQHAGQNHQAGGYGGYAGFSSYGSYNRGGWGGNYGGH